MPSYPAGCIDDEEAWFEPESWKRSVAALAVYGFLGKTVSRGAMYNSSWTTYLIFSQRFVCSLNS
jgi:hypothetical protein